MGKVVNCSCRPRIPAKGGSVGGGGGGGGVDRVPLGEENQTWL